MPNKQTAGLGFQAAYRLVAVALAGADGADRHHLAGAACGCVGDGDGVLVAIENDEQRGGRVFHG